MAQRKPVGVTETERILAAFGERTFLKLWSYANPYRENGHELCDFLAVFGDDVFIFFDRKVEIEDREDNEQRKIWDRWKRKVIDKQVNTAHGVERYLRAGRRVFVDGKRKFPLPIEINVNSNFHKIIVAHGAKEACERSSSSNVYGSLAITYVNSSNDFFPFHIRMDRENPVHVLDSHNLSIVLGELDTITDFTAYLKEKCRAIARFEMLAYCGEEDLLAHYLLNFDTHEKRHVIGVGEEEGINVLMIGEGEWRDFIETEMYKNTKLENEISYEWDALIQRTCQNALDGTLTGGADLFRGQSAIYEMIKEPRFVRRGLYKRMADAVECFPDFPQQITRQVTFLQSYASGVGYVFFQLRLPKYLKDSSGDYRERRKYLLEIACAAAKNKMPNLTKVIGIGLDAPRYCDGPDGEDFVLLLCEDWPQHIREHYEKLNGDLKFFSTPELRQFEERLTEFVDFSSETATSSSLGKTGRNEPCPCGSGKKFKKCHGSLV